MKKNREWKQVEVTDRIYVPFEWRDPTPGGENLGRAEFQVCLKYKRGKLVEFWVYPKQTRIDDYWHYTGGDIQFTIQSHERLESPKVWMVSWCHEHKAVSISVYAPRDARLLCIDYYGITFWRGNPREDGNADNPD